MQNNIDWHEMASFLIKAKVKTYASSDDPEMARASAQPSSRPDSHDLGFRDVDWFYLDTYLGGINFIGEEAVWYKLQPVWGMNYYGMMLVPELPDGFSTFLKQALRQPPVDSPFRGPTQYSDNNFSYSCQWQGDLRQFTGTESIYLEGFEIYRLYFHGGEIV